MIGQVAASLVLLAVGCNVISCNAITGVGDLKVTPGCGPDAGDGCDADPSVKMDQRPLEPPDDDSGGTARGVGDAGPGDGCAAGRDLPQIFSPADLIGARPANGCGSDDIHIVDDGSGDTGGADAGAGSGDGPPPLSTRCSAGSVEACAGAGNCAGTQMCLADGSGYSSCACAAPPLAVRGSVAAACETDAECAEGLTCTTSADVGGPFSSGAQPGGPQNGYCSRSCNTDAECQAADPGAICLGPGGSNHCFTSCDVRAPSFPAQCNGRDDLTCIPLSLSPTAPRAYCAPACQDDAACAPRFCNLSTGLCQDEPHAGKPIGAGCTDNGQCNSGVCSTLPGQPAPVCTGLCTFESPAGCGFGADAVERDAACVDTALGGGVGPGLCSELCDVDSDCEQNAAGWTCTPWSLDVILTYALLFERSGFCEFAPGAVGGGADEAGLCSEECTYTDDGWCDDGGPDSLTDFCALGSDCLDCGAR
jgi:hypothetical protein